MLMKTFSKPIFRLSVVIFVKENILSAGSLVSKEIRERGYARWAARKPSKVFIPNDISSGSINSEDFSKSEYTDKQSPEKQLLHKKNENKKDISYTDKKMHSSESQDYVVLGEHDFSFSKLMTYVGNRNMRRKFDVMMLEGKRLNLDALQAGLKPKKIFFTQKSLLDELNLPKGLNVPLFKLPYNTVKLWSRLDTPPGLLGFYRIPKEGDIAAVDTLPIKVLCDNVRDPGNMGSIIRVAASVGCREILLIKGCTDPWDSKVLRSASGGHFHIPIKMDLTWRECEDFIQSSDHVFLADSNLKRNPSTSCNLPRHLYHDVKYVLPNSIIVVIGGETEGLSTNAYTMASYCNGSRVYIPLSNCMESLNSGCALSIMLFEIKRQFSNNRDRLNMNETESVSKTQKEDGPKQEKCHQESRSAISG